MTGKKRRIGVKTLVILIFSFLLASICLFFYFKNHAAEQAILREQFEKFGKLEESYYVSKYCELIGVDSLLSTLGSITYH